MQQCEIHPTLEAFYAKLFPTPTKPSNRLEGFWMKIFRQVARQFRGQIDWTDSFLLSFDALRRCFDRGLDKWRRYVTNSCVNAHRRYLKLNATPIEPQDRLHARNERPSFVKDKRPDVEEKLDLEEALAKVGGEHEKALRMKLDGYSNGRAAKELGVSPRQFIRIRNAALWQVQALLKDYAA